MPTKKLLMLNDAKCDSSDVRNINHQLNKTVFSISLTLVSVKSESCSRGGKVFHNAAAA